MNHTAITEFVLLGLPDDPDLRIVTFFFLLIIYVLNVTGKLNVITLSLVDSHLQTPVYFFLQNFSFLEISSATVCIPRFLGTIITRDTTISNNNCAAQLFFFIFLEVTEFYILTTMSYDRYFAICKPLHYTTIMNRKLCSLLASLTKGVAILNTSVAPRPHPFIYTMRNQQVKQAFNGAAHKVVFSAIK
ncbi:hypothetical protein HPG69_015023 [Diceros bicornis minor]|uniref:G-protein coupled receptors family 1 profile domain-containing protein n=1 Tax=Diceros bicornis minor TaxID=77932 RepID=A0A7J7FKI3_DICBM|nr:hypothetical protein HPG69_015023 [Diceros bicornis minor]